MFIFETIVLDHLEGLLTVNVSRFTYSRTMFFDECPLNRIVDDAAAFPRTDVRTARRGKIDETVDDAAAFPRTDVRSARRGKIDETIDDAAAFPRTDVRSARRGKSDETVDETIGWDDAI